MTTLKDMKFGIRTGGVTAFFARPLAGALAGALFALDVVALVAAALVVAFLAGARFFGGGASSESLSKSEPCLISTSIIMESTEASESSGALPFPYRCVGECGSNGYRARR